MKISKATKSKLWKDEDFNTSHVLSTIFSSRLRKFIIKQVLEQNFKKEKVGGEGEGRRRKGRRRRRRREIRERKPYG